MNNKNTIISKKSKIHESVEIGPWTIIGDDVEIDEGTKIGPHVVINGPTYIGKNNSIFQFSSIGEEAQDKKYSGEYSTLYIGNNNTIREYVTINRGTKQGGGETRVGNNNWIMTSVHIAHDCIVGNNTTFSNNTALAGHVVVNDYVTIGGYAAIHQFCTIGAYSLIGGGTLVTKDVIPYVLVAGYNASVCGLNTIGLKRANFDVSTIENLRQAYKIIFRNSNTVQQAIVSLHELLPECPDIHPILTSLKNSSRGIVR